MFVTSGEFIAERHANLLAERDELLVERARLLQERDAATHERDEYKKLYVMTRNAYELAKLGILEQKAERLPKNDDQLSLAILAMALGSEEAVTAESDVTADAPPDEESVTIPEHQRKKSKRLPFPEHLPRVTIELLPPEVQLEGLNAFRLIGSEEREVLERRPASHFVVRLVRKKFVRKPVVTELTESAEAVVAGASEVHDGEQQSVEYEVEAAPVPTNAACKVLIAELPELPILRGRAGPGMLAATIVYRWQDHMPLHRQQAFYAREGLALAKSTLCDWHLELAELVSPVVEAMKKDALAQPVLMTDATGVLVQDSPRCKRGHFWVLVAPDKHVLFEFSQRHTKGAVSDLLAGYTGYLVADAHPIYDHLYGDGLVTEVGCWSHCRRYFIKAVASEPERAKAALVPITALFAIERTIAGAPRHKKEATRKKKSKPLVDQFFAWCQVEQHRVLDESPIEKAISYALNHEQAFRRFLEDGRLPMHNNASELALRRQAIGRKNWLFVASEDGARANTTFVSLLASCQLHGLEPWSYLRDLFCLLPSWPVHRALDLAPAYWHQTMQQEDTQQRLDANVFRRALLELDS